MNFKGFILFVAIVLISLSSTQAQMDYQFGALPAITLRKKVSEKLRFNSKIEFRQLFDEGTFGRTSTNQYEYVHTDITVLATTPLGLNGSITGGYLIRVRDNAPAHRSIQQYAITQRFTSMRLGHRIRTDQTFSSLSAPVFRLRYRAALEIPLNGETIDPTEFYVKFNNEYVQILEAGEYDLEIRLIPLLGYDISDNERVELGLDYRIDSFLQEAGRSRFWISATWYVTL